jgi:hypothetical protein
MTTIDLVGILQNAGVKNLRDSAKEISGSCPRHLHRLGRPDRHASWSINKHSYLHNCFSCGYKGTLTGLLIDLTGTAPDNLEAELARASFMQKMAVSKADIPEEEPLLTDWALENLMEDVPDNLLGRRNLHRDAIDTYEVRWDPRKRCWVMPIRSYDGTLIGAQYRQKGSVLTLPKNVEKSKTLFGITAMRQYDTIALVESPLDAVRLYGLGIPAVSSLGAWVSVEQCRLLARNFNRIVLALDNDPPGREATSSTLKIIKKLGALAIPFIYTGISEKDLGDVESDMVIQHAWKRTLQMGLS